jgi:hypothetical protein
VLNVDWFWSHFANSIMIASRQNTMWCGWVLPKNSGKKKEKKWRDDHVENV